MANFFDVIIVGGGHAGTEAALAAARMNSQCLLITHNIETLGQMSCNPAIGGVGKGHLVKEIDALGGIMALAADTSGIQFRTLNSSKGSAVQATRAQTDRQLYRQVIRHKLENTPNLSIFQEPVDDFIIESHQIKGVITQSGLKFSCKAIVLTVGTFLAGKIHIGSNQYAGGRAGDPPSQTLADKLRDIFPHTARLKTGTPPRIDKRSVDFSSLKEQPGDNPTPVFSFMGSASDHPEQVPCHITYTNDQTHDIIRGSLTESPMYNGSIEGTGPRYCPSIEDKVVRFKDKKSHQIFIEPESLTTNELYPNGVSTGLPFNTQERFIRSIKGFENAHITRPGYAIEYDFFDPQQLNSSLQTQSIKGLFFAGQINGTTGYEEAGAQGLLAGVNATQYVKEKDPLVIGRDKGYMGVLVDDLITMGTIEPYRMFTSRAEYRLSLREDNADLRLTEIGRKLGLVDDFRWECFIHKQELIEKNRSHLQSTKLHKLNISQEQKIKIGVDSIPHLSLADLLKRSEWNINEIESLDKNLIDNKIQNKILIENSLSHFKQNNSKTIASVIVQQGIKQVETQLKYMGYLQRQTKEIDRLKIRENQLIPKDFCYDNVKGLSNEVCQKLNQNKPETIGQASRISGTTPAAISIILIALKKRANPLEKI